MILSSFKTGEGFGFDGDELASFGSEPRFGGGGGRGLFWSGGERGEARVLGECDGDCDDEGVLVPWTWGDLPLEAGTGGGAWRRKPRSGGAERGGGECGEEATLQEARNVSGTLKK